MRTYLECLPCFVRQGLDAVRLVTNEPEMQEQVLRQVFAELGRIELGHNPPLMGQRIHRLIREVTGVKDAYIEIKKQCNELGRRYYPKLKKMAADSERPFETAVRIAIAGNIIDFGVSGHCGFADVDAAIARAMSAEFVGAVAELESSVAEAKSVLYVGDNTGETFFDKVLLEQLPCEKITYVVRGGAIINDALIEDARIAGIDKIVRVIDNGSDVPGTVLEQCSEDFRNKFSAADVVISKGQGNYETLSGVDKDIFFMLKAKCPVIAGHIGCEIGTALLFRKRGKKVNEVILD